MAWPVRVRRRVRYERIARRRSHYAENRDAGYEKFTDDRSPYRDEVFRQVPSCDIINLHWVADFVDYGFFFGNLPRGLPVIWRLPDMNAFTGGCHFDGGCARHLIGCGACPQINSTDPADLSRQIWGRKRAAFVRLRPEQLHFVALNRWMANQVQQSPLLEKFPVTVIPNGIETEAFAPRQRDVARDALGIPQEARVLLFAADSMGNRRKGFSVLVRALRGMPQVDNLFLASVGRGATEIDVPMPYRHFGYVDDDRQLSLIYSAADLYVIPSLQDNQPNTALEAMACGTPVVGFETGGVPDMVRPGLTGLLAKAGEVDALRAIILELLPYPDRLSAMSGNCRKVVLEEYKLETQVHRYTALYHSALDRVPQHRRGNEN